MTRTLVSIFEANRSTLEAHLKNKKIPADNRAIVDIFSNYFEEQFKTGGEFWDTLTKPEEHILQSALMLFSAQQKLSNEISKEFKMTDNQQLFLEKRNTFPTTTFRQIAIPAISAGIGGLINPLGALVFAAAGEAINIYIYKQHTPPEVHSYQEVQSEVIDVNKFMSIFFDVCKSIDNLITTYRGKIEDLKAYYNNITQPSLETTYKSLLERLQYLTATAAVIESNSSTKEILDEIRLLKRCIESYGFEFVDYSTDKQSYFNIQTSQHVEKLTQQLPAIIKDGLTIIEGKVLLPVNGNQIIAKE